MRRSRTARAAGLLLALAAAPCAPASAGPATATSPTAAPATAASPTAAPIPPAPRTDLLTLDAAPQPPVGFDHLPYANPAAPKGGSLSVEAVNEDDYDNFNPFILRGTAPTRIMGLVWQPLFAPSDADGETAYADLAQSATLSADRTALTFTLNPAARFSDGTPVTPEDVVWTFRTLIAKGQPFYAGYYAGVKGVAAAPGGRVVFTLAPDASRGLPLAIAEMYVLPEHFWKGRDFATPLTVPPVGSGPYAVSAFSFGASVTYSRVKGWWAAGLPANKGLYNFDTITERFYRDEGAALLAFRAGQLDIREEGGATAWATRYDFPAVRDGRVKRALMADRIPAGMYGFVMNTRRAPFTDVRVREALTLAFDFQWMNRVLFYGAYRRTTSYFANSPLAWPGPSALPVTDGSGYNTAQLKAAMGLLEQAGWRVKGGRLRGPEGQPMRFDITIDNAIFERIAIAYAHDLALLGIDATVRLADGTTFQRRLNAFDFDMADYIYPSSDFLGTEQADYWSCQAAKTPGSQNLAGVCTPRIDAAIRAVIAAPDQTAQVSPAQTLDRLLLQGWYIVPFWNAPYRRLAWWDKYAMPPGPLYAGYDTNLWWETR